MVAWPIGTYAMKIKNMKLLAIRAAERIGKRCGLLARRSRRSLRERIGRDN